MYIYGSFYFVIMKRNVISPAMSRLSVSPASASYAAHMELLYGVHMELHAKLHIELHVELHMELLMVRRMEIHMELHLGLHI